MYVFDELQPFFSEWVSSYPSLEAIREANLAHYPHGIMVEVGRLQGVVAYHFYHVWRDANQLFLGTILAINVIRLTDDHICLFLGELWTIGDAAAIAMGMEMASTSRAVHICELGLMIPGTRLYMWHEGTDQFVTP